MATEVRRRRGTTVEHSTFTGAVAELTVDLTKDTVVVHDGATQGGFPLLREDFSNVPNTAPFTHITLDTAIFDTTYSADGNEAQGTLYWNEDELTLSLVTNGQTTELGQKVEVHVKNQTGAQINKGEVVYASGTLGNSGRILVTKMIADGTIAAKRVVGVAAENIANGADGKVVHFGKIRKVNTDSYNEGDILWVSTTTAGAFQNTEPVQADGEIALPIAIVVNSHQNNGELFVRINAIDENEYQNYDAGLQDISGLTPSDDTIIVGNGTNWVAESGDTARASLGLTIGTHVQAWDAQLDTLSGLSADQATAIVAVTASEYQQLQNINSVTISNTQWGYLGELDQSLTQASSPTFSGLTVDGLVVEDEIRTLQSDVIENHLEIESLQDNKVELGELFPDLDKQALGTGDSVTFGGLTVNGNITVTGTVDGRDVSADGADLDELYTTIGLSALTASEVDQLENINSVTISNTQWGYLGELDQSLTTTSAVTFTTVNTGQGANELYAMNQDVQTTDNVTFNGLTANGATDLNSTLNVQGVLTTQNNVLDDGFSEGWSGTNWRITADGSAELEELRVRGALRVYEFIAKQISTIGGSEILSIAQGRVVSVDSDNDTITVENVTGTAGNSFKVNDLFICQVTDINNDLESGGTGSIVKSVRGGVIGINGNDIEVSITSGNLTDLVTGDLIVAYGNVTDADRQAIMYRNVDRSEDNLIMRLQTEINSFADLQAVGNTRVAFGDLNGYSELSTETFGFFAGKNAEEHVLITDTGIFFKDGSTVGAQLTANEFKIGDSNNNLTFNTSSGAFNIKIGDDNLSTAIADIRSDLINIYLGKESAFSNINFLAGQLTLKVGADGKVASARLDATGDESAITLRADFFDFQSNDIVLIGDPDQDAGTEAKIALGSNVDTITVTNTDSGFIATGAGTFKAYADDSNYIRLQSGSLGINAELFNLTTNDIELSNNLSKQNSDITSSVTYSDTLQFAGLFFDSDNYLGHITDVDTSANNGYLFRVGGTTSNFLEVNEAGGIAKINFDTFTLDATDASGGIKIDSTNELIQLEDANRVRTQVDVNNGTFSLTETVKYNADDETTITQSVGVDYETGSIQITKGDSFYIDIEAELITFGTLGNGDEAYITVEVYGGTTSGSQTNLIANYVADLLDTVGQRNIVRFSAYSYLYEYINVHINVNANDGDSNGQFKLKENVVVKSYNSQTRVSLDGVYVNSSNNQYARLTRSANELAGILKLSGLPTKKPQTTGIVYNDNGTLKIS